jgi:hypothetical protein
MLQTPLLLGYSKRRLPVATVCARIDFRTLVNQKLYNLFVTTSYTLVQNLPALFITFGQNLSRIIIFNLLPEFINFASFGGYVSFWWKNWARLYVFAESQLLRKLMKD